MSAPPFTAEQRRALLAAQAHGVFTRGRKGWYAGFTTSAFAAPFRQPTMQGLLREGWLEKDTLSGRLRLTDRGRIAAASVEREKVEAARPAPHAARPAVRPATAGEVPEKVRLPYADN